MRLIPIIISYDKVIHALRAGSNALLDKTNASSNKFPRDTQKPHQPPHILKLCTRLAVLGVLRGMVPPTGPPPAGLGGGVGRGDAGCDPLRARGLVGPATFTLNGSSDEAWLNLAAREETLGLPRVSDGAGDSDLAGEAGRPGA